MDWFVLKCSTSVTENLRRVVEAFKLEKETQQDATCRETERYAQALKVAACLQKEQYVQAILEEAELKVLRFEALRGDPLLLEKAQLVAYLKDVQRVHLEQLEQLEIQAEQVSRVRVPIIVPSCDRTTRLRTLLYALLRRMELILTELQRRAELIRTFLVMLWQLLLESRLLSLNVSEFPNKRRPPCTTMPRNIRPALLVLWGVCWMFYPWTPIDNIQSQPFSAEEPFLFSDPGFDNEFSGHSQLHHAAASNAPTWDLPIGDLPFWDLPSWDFSGQTGYGNLQGPHPEPFAPSSAPETQSISSVGVAPLQTTLAAPAPFSFPSKQVHGSESASYRVEPVLGYFSEAPSGGTADQLAVSSPGTTIETFEGAAVTISIDRQAIIIADDDPRKGHAQLPAESAREAAGRMERAADIPPKLTTYKGSEEPLQNAEGKLVCKYNECSNRTFTRKCDWNKHMDKHERPYVCTVDGCEHSKGFTAKGDLLRHQRIVHKSDSDQGILLFCEEPNCARGPLGGPDVAFSRPDNLVQHIRTTHGQSSTNSSAGRRRLAIANDTVSPEVRSESPRRMDNEPTASLQRKRRRTPDTGLGSQNADDEEGEEVCLRRELRKARRCVEELTEELKEVKKELTDELKEVKKRHEKTTETLLGIIERLTQQSK